MTMAGTPVYVAPEVLKMERYDERADIYSFGMLLLEMAMYKVGGLRHAWSHTIFTTMNVVLGARPKIPIDLVERLPWLVNLIK